MNEFHNILDGTPTYSCQYFRDPTLLSWGTSLLFKIGFYSHAGNNKSNNNNPAH